MKQVFFIVVQNMFLYKRVIKKTLYKKQSKDIQISKLIFEAKEAKIGVIITW